MPPVTRRSTRLAKNTRNENDDINQTNLKSIKEVNSTFNNNNNNNNNNNKRSALIDLSNIRNENTRVSQSKQSSLVSDKPVLLKNDLNSRQKSNNSNQTLNEKDNFTNIRQSNIDKLSCTKQDSINISNPDTNKNLNENNSFLVSRDILPIDNNKNNNNNLQSKSKSKSRARSSDNIQSDSKENLEPARKRQAHEFDVHQELNLNQSQSSNSNQELKKLQLIKNQKVRDSIKKRIEFFENDNDDKNIIFSVNDNDPSRKAFYQYAKTNPEIALRNGSALSTTEIYWEDLDSGDSDDPVMVSEYVDEIFDYMHDLEIKTTPHCNYMDYQKSLKWSMRDILVDWLIEVHSKFRLLPETLYLAVNIIDRFLSRQIVCVKKLQLVGATSLFIATKYEEVFSPSISNFVYMGDGGYTEAEILTAERYILEVLSFDLSYPNPMNFLRRNSKADNYEVQTRTVAKYLLEISLIDYRFLKYLPSHVAAASMYLARGILMDHPEWSPNLVHYSGGYTEADLLPVIRLMLDYVLRPVQHESFFKKYASKKFFKASILARQWAKEAMSRSNASDTSNSSDL